MNLAIPLDKFDANNIYFAEKKRNVVIDGDFIKISYSNSNIEMSELYISCGFTFPTTTSFSQRGRVLKLSQSDLPDGDSTRRVLKLSQSAPEEPTRRVLKLSQSAPPGLTRRVSKLSQSDLPYGDPTRRFSGDIPDDSHNQNGQLSAEQLSVEESSIALHNKVSKMTPGLSIEMLNPNLDNILLSLCNNKHVGRESIIDTSCGEIHSNADDGFVLSKRSGGIKRSVRLASDRATQHNVIPICGAEQGLANESLMVFGGSFSTESRKKTDVDIITRQNIEIISQLCYVETNILSQYINLKAPTKTPVYNLRAQFVNGVNLPCLNKIDPSSDSDTDKIVYILKISGLWETETNVGITLKFISTNRITSSVAR